LRGSSIRADADPDQVARHLRELLSPDAQVLTRAELFEHETSHWVARTSTGLIFGFGVIVALIVGLVILNQTLSTQITRQLPQFATLKALGYTNRDLTGIVVTLAVIMSTAGFIPAAAMAMVVQKLSRQALRRAAVQGARGRQLEGSSDLLCHVD
jgi:putative ABC transport system permease protein